MEREGTEGRGDGETMSDETLAFMYRFAKCRVIKAGYAKEIEWQENIRLDKVTELDFLRELAWVILASGMKEKIIRQVFPRITAAFLDFGSAEAITEHETECKAEALKAFNNKRKIGAIIAGAWKVKGNGWFHIKKRLQGSKDPLGVLREFSFIGPITFYHLAKNIGLPVAKPDRHLVRIAEGEGYEDVQAFCSHISELTGDSVPVVDIVLWRYATLEGSK